MYIMHVFIRVKPDELEAFKQATLENARESRKEPGVVRFDVIQQLDDPTRFVLVEVYRSQAGHEAHRETPHYNKWKETVADMMAEPRSSLKYNNLFPDDHWWG